MSVSNLINFVLFAIMIASATKRYTTSSSLSITRSSNIISSYCASMMISTNNYIANAFSTVSISPAVSSLLSDPTLLGDGISSSGDSISSSNGEKKTFDVLNPGASLKQYNDGSSSTAIISQVQKMGREDTQQAIGRASSALSEWKDGTTGAYRSSLLTKWSALIKENSEDIATIMTLESGKPLTESRGEVQYGVSFLDFFAAEAIRPSSAGGGYMVPTPFTNPDGNTPRGKIMAINEAVGVCAFITPWNFPIAMITRKVGPALAAGCTTVLKPSELTPLTAIALKVLAARAGIPEGVFEVITADRDSTKEVGDEMTRNKAIKKISFTGSTAVGKLLMKQSADTVKRLSLELGGNAPFVVFEDADIDVAVNAAMASKYRNAGQTCVCADRFLIHKSVVEEFVAKLTAKVKQTLTVGNGMKDGVNFGPVILESSVENIHEKVEQAIADGATLVVGGSALPELGPCFYSPTILTNVSTSSSIWNTETFGPVVAIKTFETEDEALLLANDSPTGLASYFCTNDLSRIFRVSGDLRLALLESMKES